MQSRNKDTTGIEKKESFGYSFSDFSFGMSLDIVCSARYLKTASWYFDKITEEYNPPSYWFRLKVFAKDKMHQKCIGYVTNLWYKNYRAVAGFDQLILFWISEPPTMTMEDGSVVTTNQHYTVDIAPGNSELAGIVRVKLPSRPIDPNKPLPPDTIPDEKLPEVRIQHSQKEDIYSSKRMDVPYGTYYIKIRVSDGEGVSTKKIFKVWAYRDSKKCQIRKARFYERFFLLCKAFLPAV